MIQLPEKDQELILNWNKQITSLGDGFKVTLFIDAYSALSIISRYQKALEKAVEQRDRETGFYLNAAGIIDLITIGIQAAPYNQELQNILNGGEG